jgi:pimeloyl-ACP methyl ester carboxylesterase
MTGPAIPGLTRHYCTLGDRQVHYRRMGHGPPLIALHRLPRSSKDLVPFAQLAAAQFTVIAPDLAGYGNSWHLPASASDIPHFREYANDIDALVAELGLKSVAVYGEGEGASIALYLASQNPERYVCAALNGVVFTTDTEADITRRSMPKFEPTWDGSHLAWLWAFLREENCFSPWWTRTLDARIDGAMPTPIDLHDRVIQFLADGRGRSGGHYGRAYHLGILSALDFKTTEHLATVNAPVLVTGPPHHRRHLLSAQAASPSTQCEFYPATSNEDAQRRSLTFLAVHIGSVDSPVPAPPAKPIRGVLWQDFVSSGGGQVHVQMNSDAPTVPLLVQHDAASSIGTVEPITRSIIGRRTVLAFDLPGSGESDNTIGTGAVDVDVYAEGLNAVLQSLGLKTVDFYGMWGGGFVGLEMALMRPTRVRRLVMSNVFEHTGQEQRLIQENYTPAIEPVWHGGHLMQCWHQMRDQGIYYPWFDRTGKGVIKREPFLDAAMVHERVCSLLKAGNMYRTAYQAHFAYPTYAKLRSSPVPTLVATTEWDPNNAHTQEAAAAAVNVQFQYLDEDFAKWGLSFLPFLDAEAA